MNKIGNIQDSSNIEKRVRLFKDFETAQQAIDTLNKSTKIVHYTHLSGDNGYAVMQNGNKYLRRNGEVK